MVSFCDSYDYILSDMIFDLLFCLNKKQLLMMRVVLIEDTNQDLPILLKLLG